MSPAICLSMPIYSQLNSQTELVKQKAEAIPFFYSKPTIHPIQGQSLSPYNSPCHRS